MKPIRSLIGIGMCAMVSLVGSNVVFAQGPAAPAPAPVGTVQERLDALEKKSDAAGLWKTLGFQLSGAVLASYTQNFNNPQTNNNNLRIFDTDANGFMPNMAQIMLERPATAGSETDRVGFRARLDYGTDARFSRARTNFQPGTSNNELDVHELYAEYIAPLGNGLKIQFGKINTLIGLEVINAWENPNFSRSFTFGLAQAFTETGVRFTYPITDMLTAQVGLVNGWDNIDDNNRGKTVTWNLALTPDPKFGISVYGSYGSEQSNGNAAAGEASVGGCVNYSTGCDPAAKRLVIGSLITFKPTDSDTLILEPYYGNESHAVATSDELTAAGGTINGSAAHSASGNARWDALIAYYTHDFNDQTQPNAFSARIRGEFFEDAGGARTCSGGVNFAGGTNTCAGTAAGGFGVPANATVIGTPQTLWEGTFTLQWKPAPALITRTEFRYDKSDKNVFLRGDEATNNQQTFSFSVAYLF